MEIIVKTEELSKRLGDFIALDNLNISLEHGEIFSLLGPNGAGKSTSLKLLTTLLKSSSGDAFIDGVSILKDPLKVRSLIGYVPQTNINDGIIGNRTNMKQGFVITKVGDTPVKTVDELKDAINKQGSNFQIQGVYPGSKEVYYYGINDFKK